MNLYQQLNPQQVKSPNNLKEQYQQFCNMMKSKNPKDFIQNMMRTNPRMKSAIDTINSLGGDPQTAFYALAKQKGVDPESILSQLR